MTGRFFYLKTPIDNEMNNNHIHISMNKKLRLDNVLVNDIVRIDLNADEIDAVEDSQVFAIVEKMKNEIVSKGAKQIGPLIQYSWSGDDDCGIGIKISLMLQADRYIENVNMPYRMESIIRAKNCLYTRFTGLEEDMRFAYQKMQTRQSRIEKQYRTARDVK